MSGTEQQYYEMLTRTDHPVYLKDYSTSQDVNSPINSIWNRIIAKQLVRIRAILDEFQLNLVPDTVTVMTIADWELQYFGYTKPALAIADRVAQLLIKFNKKFTMDVADAIALAQSITGQTPVIIRNVSRRGWVLGQGSLGFTTVLDDPSDALGQGLYLVVFFTPISSTLKTQLDQALTAIEKAGSRHVITSPIPFWVLGNSSLGIDTTLGEN